MRELPIDLEEVVMGMTDDPNIATWYLNVETGETLPVTQDEQYEMESYEDPEEADDLDPALREIALADPRWEEIPHVETAEAFRLMETFLASVSAPDERRRLEDALGGRAPFGRFRHVLSEFPGELRRWFDFHHGAARRDAISWLATLGIRAVPSRSDDL